MPDGNRSHYYIIYPRSTTIYHFLLLLQHQLFLLLLLTIRLYHYRYIVMAVNSCWNMSLSHFPKRLLLLLLLLLLMLLLSLERLQHQLFLLLMLLLLLLMHPTALVRESFSNQNILNSIYLFYCHSELQPR